MSNEIATNRESRDRLRGLMAGLKTQIADVLPRHLDPETMTRVVLVEGTRNPDLRQCSAESLAASIMLASQLGLVPSSPLGHFYLVPRREKDRASGRRVWRCGFVIGYRGYVELARRAGLRVNAGVVYQAEVDAGSFAWTEEPPTLVHKGQIGVDRSDGEAACIVGGAAARGGRRSFVARGEDDGDACGFEGVDVVGEFVDALAGVVAKVP